MGIFGNGGFINDVTSSLNPFDDENGAFQGSGGRIPITPASAGPDLSGQYWDQYGAGAQANLQGQSDLYQGALGATAGQAAAAGATSNAQLNAIGQAGTNQALATAGDISGKGSGYAGALIGAGQDLGGEQIAVGDAAGAYGVNQGANAAASGNQLASMGADIYGQAAGARGADVSGMQQAALMGLEANRGPSAAQGQLAQATSQNQANALAMARSGRGWGGSAGAMNQAAAQRVGAQQQAANQSAVITAQEDAAWRQRQASNIGASGQLATSQAGLNNAREANLYGMGMNGIQSGANLGLQGGALGLQGIGMNQAGLNAGANTYLGALGQGAQLDIGAQQAAGNMALAGYGQQGQLAGVGGQLNQTGLANAGTNYANAGSYGLNNQAAQGAIVGQQYGLAQQNQQNALQASAINNGLAIQQQNMGNQQMGAMLGMVGTAAPMLAAAASDRNVKEDIEPANNVLTETEPTIVVPSPDSLQPVDQNGNAYDPYSFGTGISGDNQAQGMASSDAAQGASVAGDAARPSASSTKLKEMSSKDYGFGAGATPMSAIGKAMSGGATNAMGDTTVNPVTGQSWFGGNSGGVYPMQQPSTQQLPMISDEREKEAMRAFDETPGFSYNYKDPEMSGATEGRQFGIMAQDLEKTPAGKSVVKEGPGGVKMVDTSRLALVEGAALNGALKRIAELEKRLGSKPKGKAA